MDSEMKANTMLGLIWMISFFNSFIVLIILLNFLISIVSQSFESVMSQRNIYKYKERV